jgi:hypothetical protein
MHYRNGNRDIGTATETLARRQKSLARQPKHWHGNQDKQHGNSNIGTATISLAKETITFNRRPLSIEMIFISAPELWRLPGTIELALFTGPSPNLSVRNR